jgi:hypothetical protein
LQQVSVSGQQTTAPTSGWSTVSNGADRTYTAAGINDNTYFYRVRGCADVCSGWMVSSGYYVYELPAANVEGAPAPVLAAIPAEDTASASVGLMKDSFRVNESGAATYSLPLSLPQGIADVTPSISLNYSSVGNNGVMGIGWNIGGLSAIQRCRQTFEQDGNYLEITMTNSDAFCLDGQRLVAVEGENGAVDTVYSTEIDSKVLVTSKGTSGNGPAYFEVKRADGSTTYYGGYGSGVTSVVKQDDGTVINWLIGKVKDNMDKDNYVTYTYAQGAGEHEVLIDTVSYSSNSVVFKYNETSYNGSTDKPDTRSYFTANIQMDQTARLDEIVIKNHSGVAINSYHLDYTKTAPIINDQTQLASVQQCNGSLGGVCLPATEFDWKNELILFTPKNEVDFEMDFSEFYTTFPLDYNGDGRTDFAYVGKTESVDPEQYVIYMRENDGTYDFPIGGPRGGVSVVVDRDSAPEFYPMDIDGDGKQDIVYKKTVANITTWNVWKLNSSGGGYESTMLAAGIAANGSYIMFSDMTGDGLPDMFYTKNSVNYVQHNLGLVTDNQGVKRITFATPYLVTFPDLLATESVSNFKSANTGDFNGDGLVDMIVSKHSSFETTVNIEDNGQSFVCDVVQITTTKQIYESQFNALGNIELVTGSALPGSKFTQVNLGESTQGAENSSCYLANQTSNLNGELHLADFNGDGLTDVVQIPLGGEVYQYLVSKGSSFTPLLAIANLSGDVKSARFADVNNDGLLDFLYFMKIEQAVLGKWYYHTFSGGAFNDKVALHEMMLDFNIKAPMWLDVTSNGKTDFLLLDYVDKTLQPHTWGEKNLNSRIKTITNGFGLKTEIAYKPLTDNTVYTKGEGAQDIDDYGKGSPVFDLVNPAYVVSGVTSDAPSFPNSTGAFDASAVLSIEYRYEGLRAQSGGRGLLGFAKVTSYDPQALVTTESTYRQDFPYVGFPITTKQCLGDNSCDTSTNLLSSTLNIFNDDSAAQTAEAPESLYGGVVYTSGVYQNISDSYSHNSSGTTTFVNRSETTNTNTKVTQASPKREYLALTEHEIKIYDSTATTANILSTQLTANTYGADNIANWWVNRLTRTQVTHTRGTQAPIVRTSAFEYDPVTGLLGAEIIEPGQESVANSETYLRTEHVYDEYGYGRVVKTTQCSQHYASDCTDAVNVDTKTHASRVYRQKITSYGDVGSQDAGRYATATGDHLFNLANGKPLSTVSGRSVYGGVTTSSNIDGIINDSRYDSFGRLYFSRDNAGSASTLTRRLKADAINDGWPTISLDYHFAVRNVSAGKPTVYQYTDLMGRDVANVVQGFADSTWIYQYAGFDALGRMVKKSLPFKVTSTGADTIYWHKSTFDKSGRPLTTKSADSDSGTVFNYNGLVTTSTMTAKGLNNESIVFAKSQASNRLGEALSVTDTTGTITYGYNSIGNLITTTGVDNAVIITNFDDYGHKSSMSDPDKGDWSYT